MTLLRTGEINEVDCRRKHYDTVLEKMVRQDLEYQGAKQKS